MIASEFIYTGEVAAGERLPSEHQLSERDGISRVTVHAALHSLRHAGLIATRQGVGALVLRRPPALVHGLDRLSSIETFAREGGQAVGSEQLEWEEIEAGAEAAGKLSVPVGNPLLAIRRARVVGSSRVAWIVDVVPKGVIPFEIMKSEFAGSALASSSRRRELGVEYAEMVPLTHPPELAEKLEVGPGTAALFMDTVFWTADERPIVWAKVWLLPEHFHLVLRRPKPFGEWPPDSPAVFSPPRES